MNMKKTIAAIAAGAVAVSAMATTVFAEDATSPWGNKTVTFNLVQTVEKVTGYQGTITLTVAELSPTDGTDVEIYVNDLNKDDVVTVSGYYVEDGKPLRTMVFTKNDKEARYSPAGAAQIDLATNKITIPTQATSDAASSGFTLVGGGKVYLNVVVEKKVKYGVEADAVVNAYKNDDTVRANMNSVLNAASTAVATASVVEVSVKNGTNVFTSDANKASVTANTFATPATVSGFAEMKETKKYPYYSHPTSTLGGGIAVNDLGYSGNVLGCVFQTGTAGNKINAIDINSTTEKHIPAYYVSNIINDAINSYGNVTFTFNTYKDKLANDSDGYSTFSKNWWQLDTGDVSGLFDGTNYWINNWEDMSLFGSALIVNSNLTFSLSDAQAMKWTKDALTFDWDDVQATALNPNDFTNYVQSMVLRTGKDWYWESLVVTFEEGVVEKVIAGAGDEPTDTPIIEDPSDDTDDIDDFGDDDDDDFGDDDDDDFGDDDFGDDDTDDTDDGNVADNTDEGNPKTGNPAVALAVIPVALAAAAVVAKKRG